MIYGDPVNAAADRLTLLACEIKHASELGPRVEQTVEADENLVSHFAWLMGVDGEA